MVLNFHSLVMSKMTLVICENKFTKELNLEPTTPILGCKEASFLAEQTVLHRAGPFCLDQLHSQCAVANDHLNGALCQVIRQAVEISQQGQVPHHPAPAAMNKNEGLAWACKVST
jgi:hypothetical protein